MFKSDFGTTKLPVMEILKPDWEKNIKNQAGGARASFKLCIILAARHYDDWRTY